MTQEWPGQKQANIRYTWNEPRPLPYGRQYTYELAEPVAMGYDDPPEMVSIAGPGGPFKIPPLALEYMAVTWLRMRGFFVSHPRDMKWTALFTGQPMPPPGAKDDKSM